MIKSVLTTWMKVLPVTSDNPIKFPSSKITCGSATVPANLLSTGSGTSEYDLVIFVLAGTQQASWMAYAGSCLLGNTQQRLRPIAGSITFNTMYLSTDPSAFEGNLGTAIHELTHVLFFSSNLFASFVDQNGVVLGAAKVSQNGKIITPKVLQAIRAHFNYPEMTGAPLEDDGGSGTAGSHWERLLFLNEYMTGSFINNQVWSKFSFALAEDSGWYIMDYSKTQEFLWGKNGGKEFVENKCNSTDPKARKFFCYDQNSWECTSERDGYGDCVTDSYANGCMYRMNYDQTVCYNPANLQSQIRGDIFGAGSKCFSSTVIKTGYSTRASPIRCHTVVCDPSGSFITVNFGNTSVQCNLSDAGQQKSPSATSGYSGAVTCPDNFDAFCPGYKHCMSSDGKIAGCSGNGLCIRGVCQCAPGFSGAVCESGSVPN